MALQGGHGRRGYAIAGKIADQPKRLGVGATGRDSVAQPPKTEQHGAALGQLLVAEMAL